MVSAELSHKYKDKILDGRVLSDKIKLELKEKILSYQSNLSHISFTYSVWEARKVPPQTHARVYPDGFHGRERDVCKVQNQSM